MLTGLLAQLLGFLLGDWSNDRCRPVNVIVDPWFLWILVSLGLLDPVELRVLGRHRFNCKRVFAYSPETLETIRLEQQVYEFTILHFKLGHTMIGLCSLSRFLLDCLLNQWSFCYGLVDWLGSCATEIGRIWHLLAGLWLGHEGVQLETDRGGLASSCECI